MDVIITSFPILHRDLDKFEKGKYHLLVLDEAQAIKNPRSQNHKAVKSLDAAHRLCLSGTPVENNLDELWSQFDFLMPGFLGKAEKFRRQYRVPIEQTGDEERADMLRQRVAPFILRRLKETVATDLPPKTPLVHRIDVEDDQRRLYESIRLAVHEEVRGAITERGLERCTIPILDALTKLRQVCCDPRLLTLATADRVQKSAKFEFFFKLLNDNLAEGRHVLVFSQFTRMLGLIGDRLNAQGTPFCLLTGSTADRQRQCDIFQAGEKNVFLISLKAGGTGLNLTRADTVIHYDPWWNPTAQAQATDRAYRIGQKNPVFVHDLIIAGGVEEKLLMLQKRKRALADAILSTGGMGGLQPSDVDDLFAPL